MVLGGECEASDAGRHADPVTLTGERTWPNIPRENYWFVRHVACYRWAADNVARLTPDGALLDAGSGEGYGAALLAGVHDGPVLALELDEGTVHHAKAAYRQLTHVRGNLVSLPFRDGCFSAAISLQVVEHIWDPVTYLRELDRCTRGPVIISTPNRPVHSPHLARGERPDNPFHVQEFDVEELLELFAAASNRPSPAVAGLRHGPKIEHWEAHHGSLPHALIRHPDAPHVAEFASTVTSEDFVIEHIESSSSHADVQDLVAIW